jgi:two-component system cell cycle response regulator
MNHPLSHRFDELKADDKLPSPKGVALKILEVARRSESSIDDIVKLVKSDPVMTGRILRYANASHGGSLRHLASVAHAVAFLGMHRVRQIVLGFSLIDGYRDGRCEAFDYPAYWARSLATAVAAQHLAALAHCPPDESFSCGLLARIGDLALATLFPQQYSALLQRKLSGMQLLEAEHTSFGIDHTQLTYFMLSDWGFPDVFAKAVLHHEQPADHPFGAGSRIGTICAAIHLAGQVGVILTAEQPQRWKQVPALVNDAAQLGIGEADVPEILEKSHADWLVWASEIGLRVAPVTNLPELFVAQGAEISVGQEAELGALHLKIFLLIDDRNRRHRLASLLRDIGIPHIIDAAKDSTDALLRTADYDLVIVDCSGVSESPLPYLKRVFADRSRAPYVIALLAIDDEPNATRLLATGAADFLTYECSKEALIARLGAAQRLLALQGLVLAERELALTASGEWARNTRRLLHEALTDPLTQLPNRRYGLDRFAQEWSVATSNNLPFACLMADIDHFKQVNDNHGHDVGDLVLKQVSAAIERVCRRGDVVFRYGGEEFCIICVGAAESDAEQCAQRILNAVRSGSFGASATPLQITLSVGYSVRTPSVASQEELIHRADIALYQAKNAGRNCSLGYSGNL